VTSRPDEAQHLRDLARLRRVRDRIETAMALLRRGDLSVAEVCFAVGCSSLGSFSSPFTELAGVPPSTYRRHAARATPGIATAGVPSCVAKQVTRQIRNREASAASLSAYS
jgi:AraC-like DNA-binding protein